MDETFTLPNRTVTTDSKKCSDAWNLLATELGDFYDIRIIDIVGDKFIIEKSDDPTKQTEISGWLADEMVEQAKDSRSMFAGG